MVSAVIVFVAPPNVTLYPAAAVARLAAVRSPLNATVPVVAVRVTAPAVTAPLNTVPPESVSVRSPPPSNDATVMSAAALFPASRVRAFPPLVTAPTFSTEAAPVPVSRTAVPRRVTAPRSICVFVVATVPPILTPVGPPVVSRPPVNVLDSVPAALPSVNVPVFRKLVSAVIVFVAPPIVTLYPAAAVVRLAAVRLPLNATVPVVAVNVTVPAVTAAAKVTPPESVTVRAPSTSRADGVTW